MAQTPKKPTTTKAGASRKAKSTAKKPAAAKPGKGTRARTSKVKAKTPAKPWGNWALAVILGVAVVRLSINVLGLVPPHFDEAQYWAYGHELTAGHFSKPPLVGWLIYATTAIGGDTTFALRIGAVAAHAGVAAFIFLIARRLFDGQTGFWAATGYTLAPGVSVSAMIMSTDPVMMAAWGLAMWAWIKAAEGEGRHWWVVMGVAIGLGMLAKYTMLAFAAGALGYGLFSARGRDWTGLAIVTVTGLIVFSPNLFWQLSHDFVTTRHVAEDAAPPGALWNIGKLGEFLGAQLGVIGPLWFLAMLGGLFWRGWGADWRMRLLGWQTFTLLVPIIILSFVTRAQPNWAAPAYVAGSIFAARYFLTRDWGWALKWQVIPGVLAAVFVYVAAAAYAYAPQSLPRSADPFKKMRIGPEFCASALAAMGEEGAEAILSNDRRRLSECMFLGEILWQDIAVWNPDPWPDIHHELGATLQPGDERVLILATLSRDAAVYISKRFRDAREIETGTIQTHKNTVYSYSIWVVQGFKDY